eukprot:5898045-Amphidinium_carterae.1
MLRYHVEYTCHDSYSPCVCATSNVTNSDLGCAPPPSSEISKGNDMQVIANPLVLRNDSCYGSRRLSVCFVVVAMHGGWLEEPQLRAHGMKVE